MNHVANPRMRPLAKVVFGGVAGAGVVVVACIVGKIVAPQDMIPLVIAFAFGIPAGFLAGGVIALFRIVDRRRAANGYERVLRFVVGLGVVTFVGGLLWGLIGAGIYGSPLGALFKSSDDPDSQWAFWILHVVVAGPLAILPCALIERRARHWGAVTMVVAAAVTAEAGIRASYQFWGFSDDALIVIVCVTTPMLLLAAALFVAGVRQYSLRTLLIAVAGVAIVIGGIQQRYIRARDYWNAHAPFPLPERTQAVPPIERMPPIRPLPDRPS